MATGRNETEENTLTKCVKAPFRALTHIRNFYIYSMIQCSGHVRPGGNVPARQTNSLPRVYSNNLERQGSASHTLNEDFRELVKAASTRRLADITQLEDVILQRQKSQGKKMEFPESGYMQRSSTVTGMERIDEEDPGEFRADDVKARYKALPTSRSHR
ncbi:hypothetical protein MLD38_028530 [Melastoma candidum]|uniref:Uncharacterized protein n=1 Tax=Melastoma candidum TaxID=119954 RepID=A0ACB9N772_9MYRT|nr:hypothetical protein MLD38_028530 [Melastoma candidum]